MAKAIAMRFPNVARKVVQWEQTGFIQGRFKESSSLGADRIYSREVYFGYSIISLGGYGVGQGVWLVDPFPEN
jgi:hypothetical protein